MIRPEELNYEERRSYEELVKMVNSNSLTIGTLREKLTLHKETLIKQLCTTSSTQEFLEINNQLKGRILNLCLVIDILESPIKAQKAYDEAIRAFEKKVDDSDI